MKPLQGRRIVLTREKQQATALACRLEQLGAEVILCPLLQFVPPDDPEPLRRAAARVAEFDWLVFTSANGVRFFFEAVAAGQVRACQVAAIGAATARQLQEAGINPRLVATESVAEGLLAAFEAIELNGARVLLPRAQEAREVLPEGLRARGAAVEVVPVYKTVPAAVEGCDFERADWVVLMSASSARHLRQVCPGDPACLCVGPVTASAARELGFRRIEQAQRYDAEGVVARLLELCRAEDPGHT